MDDGRLTDGKGRTVDFKNTIIIMTSNLPDLEAVKKRFPPEFVNRLDKVIVFSPLTPAMMEKIVELQLKRVEKRLKKQKITLEVSSQAKKYLAKKGFDPEYGARPLKRLIQEAVLNPLALKIVEGKIKEGKKVLVDVDQKGIVLK